MLRQQVNTSFSEVMTLLNLQATFLTHICCAFEIWGPLQNSELQQQNTEFKEEPKIPFITCLLIMVWIYVI